MLPLPQNGVLFQVKAREKPVMPHVKTEATSPAEAQRPPTDLQRPHENSLKNVGMKSK